MNYSKRIREIDNEIEDLEKHLKEIEQALKVSDRINFKFSMIRDYGFYKMMTDEMMIGYLIQDFGRREQYNTLSDASKLKVMRDEMHKKILDLRTEQNMLFIQRNSSVTDATLVAEGNKLYIKGDPNKTDILGRIKEERQKLFNEIENYHNDKQFMEFMTVRENLIKAFNETDFPKYDISNKQNILNLMVTPLVFYDKPYKEVLGYTVPTFDYRNSLPNSAEAYKKEAEFKMNNIEAEIGPFKPSFFAKINSKAREKQENLYKQTYEKYYNFYKKEYDKAVKILDLYPEFNKKFNEPYFDKIKPLADRYEELLNQNYYLETKLKNYSKSVKQYQNCKYNEGRIYYITGLLPDKAVDFLEENNLNITEEEILKHIDKIEDKDIVKEVKNKFAVSNEEIMSK